jgi:hypothetical protein
MYVYVYCFQQEKKKEKKERKERKKGWTIYKERVRMDDT